MSKTACGYSLSGLWKMNKKQSIPMLFAALQEVGDLQRQIKELKNDLRICADGCIPHGMVGGIVECEREKRHKAEEENKKLEEENKELKAENDNWEADDANLTKIIYMINALDDEFSVSGVDDIYDCIKDLKEENEELNEEVNGRVHIEDIAEAFGSDEGEDFDWESEIAGLVEENKKFKAKIEKFKEVLTQE